MKQPSFIGWGSRVCKGSGLMGSYSKHCYVKKAFSSFSSGVIVSFSGKTHEVAIGR